MDRIALQLYSVRDDLLSDPDSTLARVRAMGFESVEAMHWPESLPIDALWEALQRAELDVCSLHCSLPNPDNIRVIADAAARLGTKDVVWHGWPMDPGFDTRDGVVRLVDSYRVASECCDRHALRLSLHNHWWEYQRIPGTEGHIRPIDLFREHLADDVLFEPDTYWICVAGGDPVEELTKMPKPIRHVHLKDGPGGTHAPKRALGDGILPIQQVLAVIPATAWKIIELDDCDSDIWSAIEISRQRLSDWSIDHGTA